METNTNKVVLKRTVQPNTDDVVPKRTVVTVAEGFVLKRTVNEADGEDLTPGGLKPGGGGDIRDLR